MARDSDPASRRTGPRARDLGITERYRLLWAANRLAMRALFRLAATGLDRCPEAPFQLVCNHHNGFDPLIVLAVTPIRPRITWFGPIERDFGRGFKNRVMAFYGGVIPIDPDKTTLLSASRAVRRVFHSRGVLGIFAEGRAATRETQLLPFQEGATAFAVHGRVPIVPCAIVGSSELWLRRRVEVRFGAPIMTAGTYGRDATAALERRVVDAVRALLPDVEPVSPRGYRPMRWLTRLLR
ncbi:MAG: 1-acyl-sn-glycerol-3-phosphate acyltransferase [Chloroflexota bacterium]|nr:1-acyl-sn-glycerol-3-phosphate acyltransferase [Chloroflexota bacterium]